MLTWGRWREANRDRMIVARTDLPGGVRVSTVFLGIDHGWSELFGDPVPVLWETMIFGGPEDMYQERYVSHALAVEGHSEAVRRACNAASIEVPIPPATIH